MTTPRRRRTSTARRGMPSSRDTERADVLVREATDEDWPDTWSFLSRIVAAGETYCWPRDASEESCRQWWMAKPGGRVFVAVERATGRVVGTVEVHPNQPGGGSHVANAGFMVDPDVAGRGIGRALAVHALAEARLAGFHAMQFNAVVETNVHAVALWHSLGFRTLAIVPGAFHHPTAGYVGLHVMHRVL